jgi:hypothetical protein
MISDSMIDSRPPTTRTPPAPPAETRPRSALLWVLLVLGVLVNVTATSVLANVYVSSASGLLVLGCVAALALRTRVPRTGA